MNLSTEKKIMDLENRFLAAQGESEGMVGIGLGAWGYWIQLGMDLHGDPAEMH